MTGRGLLALGLAPLSALAGVLLGAEELVLLAVALGAFLAVGLVQCAGRAGRATGHWRLVVHLDSADVRRGTATALSVVAMAGGRAGRVPVRLEDPSEAWERMRSSPGPPGPTAPRWSGPGHSLSLPRLAEGGSVTMRFNAPTAQRGVFRLPGVTLWCADALGLFAVPVAQGPGAAITVLPIPEAVPVPRQLLLGQPWGDEAPETVVRQARIRQDLGDFAGLRAYVPGDRLRLIYWPALARTGDLLVRDFEDTSPRRVHLVADVRPHLGHRGIEAVLAAVAAVGLEALAAGSTVELVTSVSLPVALSPGPAAELAWLRLLASLDTEPTGPRGGGAANPAAGRSHQLVVTTPGGANSLAGILRSGYLVVTP
ncbi:MAG TPA: DUF58 domain-containing protein [Acidimicrobiales bacterium]